MIPTRALAAVAAAGLLAAASALAHAGDIIQKKDGSFTPAIKGTSPEASDHAASNYTVLDADLDEVAYQIPLNNRVITQKMKAADVMEIWLDPSRYKQQWKEASDAMAAGEYAEAQAGFKAVGDDRQAHPLVRQKALLYSARSVAAADRPDDVNGAYEYMLKLFPKSFYTRAARKDLINFYNDRNDPERALEEVKKLLALPGVTAADKLEARFLQVSVAFRKAVGAKDQAGIQKALDEYKAIVQETAGKKDLVDVNRLARVGVGNCLLEQNNVKEAKGLFEEIAEAGTDNGMVAAAYNGLGECWFRSGTPEGYAEARFCFLRTVTMYAEGTPGDQVARALYFAGECNFRLQENEFAQKELNECIRRFAKSPWAEKARRLKLNIK